MNKKGWTLVEVLIVVTMIGILSLSVSSIFYNIWQFYKMSYAQKELQEEARVIMELITRNLRNGVSDTIVISRYDDTQPYYSKIDFNTVDGLRVSYYQIDRTLYQEIDGNKKVLSKNVTYFAITPSKTYELNIISVAITLEKELYELKKKALHMASEKVMVMN
jgi:prepilin-type N-terminal cleavage/methylation domain-containing protein